MNPPPPRSTLFPYTTLFRSYTGVRQLWLKAQSENPSGSFKDNGMTVAVSHARFLGKDKLACSSTGNTSSSLAMYAALARSEEHTSELQSPCNLVSRLLLEKK